MLVPAAVAVGLVVMQMATSAAADLSQCATTCGNVSVPYPFGLSAGCHLPGFNLTCDTSQTPPRLLLGGDDGGLQVIGISLRDTAVRVVGMHIRFNATTIEADRHRGVWSGLPDGGPFLVSPDRNSFVVTGCYALGQLSSLSEGGNDTIITGCASFCPLNSSGSFRDNKCAGIGCCRVPIKWALASYSVLIIQTQPILKIPNYVQGPPRQVFIAESAWLATAYDQLLDNTGRTLLNGGTTVIPVVLDWAVGKTGCGGACSSTNSFCNATAGGGG